MAKASRRLAELTLQALRQRNECSLANYEPTPTQLAYHQSTCMRRLIEGANRSGKSYSMAQEMGWVLSRTHPYREVPEGGDYFLMSLSRDQAHLQWAPYLLGKGAAPNAFGYGGAIPNWAIKTKANGKPDIAWESYSGKRVPVEIPTIYGSRLILKWHGDKNVWRRMQGLKLFGAWLDEAGDDTEMLLAELEMRLTDARTLMLRGELPKGSIMLDWGATPTDCNESLEIWRAKGMDPDEANFRTFHIDPSENKHVSAEARQVAAEGMSDEQRAIRVDGTASAMAGRYLLPTFHKDAHVRVKPYIPGPTDNIICAYDPGGRKDDTGILFAYLSPDRPKLLRVFKFITGKSLSTPEEAALISEVLNGRKLSWLAYDKQGACHTADRGTGQSILDQLKERLREQDYWWDGMPHYRAPKSKPENRIKMILKYLAPPPDFAPSPLIEIDPPSETNGLGKFIRELRQYRLKSGHGDVSSKSIYEKDNEGPDCLGMMLLSSHGGPEWRDRGLNVEREPVMRLPPPKRKPDRELTIEELVNRERMEASKRIAAGRKRRGKRRHRR